MNTACFNVIAGSLIAVCGVSVVAYFIVLERKSRKNHGKAQTFRDVYEDNAPTNRDLADEYERDCGRVDHYPY